MDPFHPIRRTVQAVAGVPVTVPLPSHAASGALWAVEPPLPGVVLGVATPEPTPGTRDGAAEDGMAEDGMAEDGMAEDGMAEDGSARNGVVRDAGRQPVGQGAIRHTLTLDTPGRHTVHLAERRPWAPQEPWATAVVTVLVADRAPAEAGPAEAGLADPRADPVTTPRRTGHAVG